MIRFQDFSFSYPGAAAPALSSVDLVVPEGDLAVLVGATGSGKSTLLRAVNGLVPHFTGGHVEGRVVTGGRDPREHPPRELADVVGVVGQNPLAGFVTETVEDELAYGMEQLAVPPETMRRRVEEMLDAVGVAHLRRRALRTLSGGEQQRVAIASALTTAPRILVLDEPTSALDPAAAEEVLATVLRLVHDLGVTVLLAEHRLERVVEHADQLVVVEGSRVSSGPAADLLEDAPLAPPLVELGRLCGWRPLPLSVREARRAAAPLRDRLAGRVPPAAVPAVVPAVAGSGGAGLAAQGVVVRHGEREAVRGVDLAVSGGEVVALMGRNGSGKSSLLWALHGAGRRTAGTVRIAGRDPNGLTAREAAGLVTLVPQHATDLLYRSTVDAELTAADRAVQAPAGTTRGILDELLAGEAVPGDRHPRDLSDGQRLALALAVQLTGRPDAVLLDEPTRGLDYQAKQRLRMILRGLAGEGRAVLVATHDVEFVAVTAHRVVVLSDGEVISDADTAHVLAGSPVFAPQVAKVMAPQPWLTVDQVAAALGDLEESHAAR